jgi:hypothetical protein
MTYPPALDPMFGVVSIHAAHIDTVETSVAFIHRMTRCAPEAKFWVDRDGAGLPLKPRNEHGS